MYTHALPVYPVYPCIPCIPCIPMHTYVLPVYPCIHCIPCVPSIFCLPLSKQIMLDIQNKPLILCKEFNIENKSVNFKNPSAFL